MVNVGNYTSHMDGMGIITCFFVDFQRVNYVSRHTIHWEHLYTYVVVFDIDIIYNLGIICYMFLGILAHILRMVSWNLNTMGFGCEKDKMIGS